MKLLILLGLIFASSFLVVQTADANFMQRGGTPTFDLYPGESGTWNWALFNTYDFPINATLVGSREGIELTSFESFYHLPADSYMIVPLSATIPLDYDQFGDFQPRVSASAHYPSTYNGSEGWSANMAKDFDITVLEPEFCGELQSTYNIIKGTEDRDFLIGTSAPDLIFGLGGNDYIRGGNGNDCIFGGDGHDLIQGGYGDDTLYGGIGDDVLRSGPGSDALFGEEGHDVLRATHAEDSNVKELDGGEGGYDVCVPSGPGISYQAINCEITE